MKKLALFSILILVSISFSYARSAEDVYKSFASERGAHSVSVGRFAMWVANKFNRDLKKVKSVRVLSLSDCSHSVRDKFSKETASLELDGYETLVRVNEDNEGVKVLIKVKNDAIRELLIFTTGSDPALIQVKGVLKVSDIDKYINS